MTRFCSHYIYNQYPAKCLAPSKTQLVLVENNEETEVLQANVTEMKNTHQSLCEREQGIYKEI